MNLNSLLQWSGTTSLIVMYLLMSFRPDLYPWNIVAGLVGGLCYLAWSHRTRNRAQITVNLAGVTVCVLGLIKAWG